MADGNLQKLLIEAYTSPDYSGSPTESFQVYFNPDSYTVNYEVEYEEDQGRGTTGLPQRYKSSKPQQFSITFLLDGTGASGPLGPDGAPEKIEVIDRVRHFLRVVHDYQGEIHRPPYLKVAWGTLLFECVFKDATVKYTLFRPDGSPLRAQISASFIGSVDDEKRVAQEGASSPDLTRVHTVVEGETLALIAHRHYGDVRRYIDVARWNGLDHFRSLASGTRIVLPPVARQGRGSA